MTHNDNKGSFSSLYFVGCARWRFPQVLNLRFMGTKGDALRRVGRVKDATIGVRNGGVDELSN